MNPPASSATEAGANGPRPLRILILDDVAWDAELIQRELLAIQPSFSIRVCRNEAEFRSALSEFAPDLVLSDFNIPHFSGAQALEVSRSIVPDTPFIVVSGAIGEEHVASVLCSGATDYVAKNNLTRLESSVRRAVQERQMRISARQAVQGLRDAIEVIRGTKRAFKSPVLGQLRTRLEELLAAMPWWSGHS